MKHILKKVRKSEVYEIMEEQSAMIIFVATLFGSLLSLCGKIYNYMYSLGRFHELLIPQYLIDEANFSFGDIFSVLATIFCFGIAVITMIAVHMLVSAVRWKYKIRYKYSKKLMKYIKNLLELFVVSIICLIPIIVFNLFLSVILFGINIISFIIAVPTFAFFEFFVARTILKEKEAQSKDKDKFEKENKKLENELISKMTDEEINEYNYNKDRNNKKLKISGVLLLMMVPVLLISILGISQYSSGKNSATDETKCYQVFNIAESEGENESKCQVILAECKDGYIVADAYFSGEGKDSALKINCYKQKVITLMDVEYENKYFAQICLEDPE